MWRTLLALTLISAAPDALAAERPMTDNARTITVSGDAELQVAPDEVAIDVAVETSNKDLEKAKKENDERIKRIIAAARAAGVEEKRIATDQLNIEPYYSSGSYSSSRTMEGFTVRRGLQLTLRDTSRFDAVLSGVVTAGVTSVQNVRFTTTQLRSHRDRARELAVKAAQEKAALLAKAAGVKLGHPRTINEGSGGWWSSYRSAWGAGPYSQNVSQNVGGGGAVEGTLAPGLISVTANVTITFDLE